MTRLTALELFGFKSFADRTRFEFPDGITVVVGPNGAGKSNVVDAIKWVLGEQSVRSLRGKDMTDVIFAGSTARKPLNMAEVTLSFDNAGRELPVQADTVQIARRVYRNGESEYLVNGEPARLRDIRDLFSGTGAATEAYSVIEQGRVDALLVASGRDRRAVFEEAAGITRFRTRRAEALRRLERAEQNRQRLADIVGEVSSRLETVRNQAARARRWKAMHDRLRRFRIAAAARDLAEVDAAIAAGDDAIGTTRAALAENDSRVAGLSAAVAALTHAAEALLPRLTAGRGAAAAETQRLAAAEATERLVRGRSGEFQADLATAAAAVATAAQVERNAAAAVTDADAHVAAIAATLGEIRHALVANETAAAGSVDDAAAGRRALAAATAAVADATRIHLRLEADADRGTSRAADARAAADAARVRAAEARSRHAALGESLAARSGHLQALQTRLSTAAADVESLESAQRDGTSALQHAWQELAGWQASLGACRERRDVLADVVERRDGLSEASRRLLGNATNPGIPGLAGVVADLVDTGVEWAPLVDLALGAIGTHLVVDSIDETIGWHAAWAASPAAADVLAAGGRIGFLSGRDLADPDAFRPDGHPGVVGRLDRLVADGRQTAGAADVVRRLLGRVWVVERIEHALPLLAGAPAGTTFITRDGTSLTADGEFAIGSPAGTTGLVARRSELRALDARRIELAATVERCRARIDGLQAELAEAAKRLAVAVARRQDAAAAVATAGTELEGVVRDEQAAAMAITAAEADARRVEQRAVAAETAAEAARRELAAAAARVDSAREEEADRQRAIEAADRRRGATVDELHRLRVEEAATSERLGRAHDAAAAAAATLVTSRDDAGQARARLEATRRRVAAHELEVLAAEAVRAEAAWVAERAETDVTELTRQADATDARRHASADGLEAARAEAASLAGRLHGLELEAGDARHRRARIVDRIRDEYDVAVDATTEPGPEGDDEPVPDDRLELESRIEDLRRRLASMASVNLEALRESEELAERLSKLEAQLADVTEGRESIAHLIARIDEDSRRLLADTIETVRGHFRDLFERVFGGGQADIVLEEGVDLLEASVEIVARPPGKEPRNISLLSGGEKTMTCVALLLAIFRSRPSPFCVLDEVDAALDEANVDRFVGVLRDFLRSTQFIVVTHSKKTMASATTLYGVTMEESGVSKRVSVRFESTAAAARAA